MSDVSFKGAAISSDIQLVNRVLDRYYPVAIGMENAASRHRNVLKSYNVRPQDYIPELRTETTHKQIHVWGADAEHLDKFVYKNQDKIPFTEEEFMPKDGASGINQAIGDRIKSTLLDIKASILLYKIFKEKPLPTLHNAKEADFLIWDTNRVLSPVITKKTLKNALAGLEKMKKTNPPPIVERFKEDVQALYAKSQYIENNTAPANPLSQTFVPKQPDILNIDPTSPDYKGTFFKFEPKQEARAQSPFLETPYNQAAKPFFVDGFPKKGKPPIFVEDIFNPKGRAQEVSMPAESVANTEPAAQRKKTVRIKYRLTGEENMN